jgi:predicted phage terminase large subunit-like protein
MCKRLRAICNAEVLNRNPLSDSLNRLYRETLLLEAQFKRFDSYMLYLELNREPSKRFWLPRREQLMPVADAIQDLIDDKLDILTISLPPGSGKSTLEIFLHSMLIGANPDKPSLASGHSNILTNSIYEGVLGIISDKEEYLWHDVYPNWKDPITNAKEQTIDLEKKHRFSSLTCRAIGASLTGATRCEQILTADDLVSGIEEAMSIERLDKLWQAYTNDLKSRKKLGCKELHLATRWSVHDPIGRLERMYADNPRFRCLVIPALNENGESNFNYKYGVGFDTQYFEDMRENLDECSFKALFMNEPIEREGLLYSEQELRRYYELPEEEPEVVIAVCDTKDKGTDYCVQVVGYKYNDDYYIDDVICDNSLPEVVDARLIECLLRNNVQMANYESNNAGGRVAKDVQQAIKERGGRTKITTKFTSANKPTKIIVNSAWVNEHCLFKAKDQYTKQSDYGKFIGMLCSYTVAGKNKNDDVPDAVSMFAEYAQSFIQRRVEVFKRFI